MNLRQNGADSSNTTRLRRGFFLAAVWFLGLVAVPASILIYFVSRDPRQGMVDDEATIEAILFEVSVESVEQEIPVNLEASWRDGRGLVAPLWDGRLITDVYIAPGSTVDSGDPIVAVDGVTRLAIHSDAPFFRALHEGDRGNDVVGLRTVLSALDLGPLGDSGTFDAELLRAVRSLAEMIGVSNSRILAFDPTWFVWLPSPSFDVAEVLVEIGLPPPGAGSRIASEAPILADVVVSSFDGQTLEGVWTLQFGRIEVRTTLTAGVPDDAGLAALQNLLTFEGDTQTIHAAVAISEADRERIEIPASAVTTSSDGILCVWVQESTRFSPVRVEVSGGRVGTAEVASGLSPGDAILVNPTGLIDLSECP